MFFDASCDLNYNIASAHTHMKRAAAMCVKTTKQQAVLAGNKEFTFRTAFFFQLRTNSAKFLSSTVMYRGLQNYLLK